jgi:hypothetical protein
MDNVVSIWKSITTSCQIVYDKELAKSIDGDRNALDVELLDTNDEIGVLTSDLMARVLFDFYQRYQFSIKSPIVCVVEKIRTIVKLTHKGHLSDHVAYRSLSRAWINYQTSMAKAARVFFSNENAKGNNFEVNFFNSINVDNMFTNDLWKRHFKLAPEIEVAHCALLQLREMLLNKKTDDQVVAADDNYTTSHQTVRYQILKLNTIINQVNTYINSKHALWYQQSTLVKRQKIFKTQVMEVYERLNIVVDKSADLADKDTGMIFQSESNIDVKLLEQLNALKTSVENARADKVFDKLFYNGLLKRELERNQSNIDKQNEYSIDSDKYSKFTDALKLLTKTTYDRTWFDEMKRVLLLLETKLKDIIQVGETSFRPNTADESYIFDVTSNFLTSVQDDIKQWNKLPESLDSTQQTVNRMRTEWISIASKADFSQFYCHLITAFRDGIDNPTRNNNGLTVPDVLLNEINDAIERIQEHGVPASFTPCMEALNQAHTNVQLELQCSQSNVGNTVQKTLQDTKEVVHEIYKHALEINKTFDEQIHEFILPFRWDEETNNYSEVKGVITTAHVTRLNKIISQAQSLTVPQSIQIQTRVQLAGANEFISLCKDGQAKVELKKIWEHLNDIWELEHLIDTL